MIAHYKLKNGQILTIRPLQVEDTLEIISYLNRVGGESDNLTFGLNEFFLTAEQEKEVINSMKEKPTSGMFVGLVENRIVASGTIMGHGKARLEHNATIGLSVRKDYWNLGIGTKLLKHMIHFAQKSGVIRNIHLEVRSDNAPAVALYKRLGFEDVGIARRKFKIKDQYYDLKMMCLFI